MQPNTTHVERNKLLGMIKGAYNHLKQTPNQWWNVRNIPLKSGTEGYSALQWSLNNSNGKKCIKIGRGKKKKSQVIGSHMQKIKDDLELIC